MVNCKSEELTACMVFAYCRYMLVWIVTLWMWIYFLDSLLLLPSIFFSFHKAVKKLGINCGKMFQY